MWTTRYVRRDPASVVDEVLALVRDYGVRNVDVNDLTAMLTKEWMLEFCAAIEARGLDVSWQFPSGTRSEAIDEEAARALYKAGCRNFTYAPESGSKRVLRQMKKKVKLPSLRTSLRGSVAAGMKTHVSIVLGTPDEELGDVLESFRLALALVDDGADTLSVMVFSPYPGSALYEELLRDGLVDVDDERWIYGSLLRSRSGTSYNHHLSGRALGTIQLAMLVSFFGYQALRKPQRTIGFLKNVLVGRQESVLDQLVQTKARQIRQITQAIGAAGRRDSSARSAQAESDRSTMDAMRSPAIPSP